MPSDTDLVNSARNGNAEAFEELVDRHLSFVYAIAYARLRQVESAEDLVQEVFLRAFLHLNSLKAPDRFSAWLAKITHNLASSWQQSPKESSRLIETLSLEGTPQEPTDERARRADKMLEEREETNAIQEAVFQLPPEQREIVFLRYFEGYSNREISRRLGISVTTVWRQLQKAHRSLRRHIEALLLDKAPTFRPSSGLKARTLAAIAAVGSLSASSKTALASTTGAGSVVSVAGASFWANLLMLLKSFSSALLVPILNVLILAYGAMANISHTNSPRERRFASWATWVSVLLAAAILGGLHWLVDRITLSQVPSGQARWVMFAYAILAVSVFGCLVFYAVRRQKRIQDEDNSAAVHLVVSVRPYFRSIVYVGGGLLLPGFLGWSTSDALLLSATLMTGVFLVAVSIVRVRIDRNKMDRNIIQTLAICCTFTVMFFNMRWGSWLQNPDQNPTLTFYFHQYGRTGWNTLLVAYYLFMWQRSNWTRKRSGFKQTGASPAPKN